MVALETQKKTGLSASGPGSSMQTNCDPLIRKLESIGELSDEDRQAMDTLLAKGLLSPLIFRCDDVDALFEQVRAAGGEVLQEPMDQFYGVRDCAFRDPAGNELGVWATA